MAEPSGILVAGGYGVVGRRIAAILAASFPGQVIVAGRDEQKAVALCAEFGAGTRGRRMDVEDPVSVASTLDGVGTVVNCVAQRELHVLRTAIARGLAYTDIAPRLAFWQGAERLSAEARRTGARVVLGAGLSPGISNMMARQLAKSVASFERIETAILLSLGDEYGPDSLHHVLESVTEPFTVMEDGVRHEAVPFGQGRRTEFPEPLGSRTAYLFPWSDVVYYPKTLSVRTALGRFALEPAWATGVASLLVRAGARRWLKRPGFFQGNRRAIDRLKKVYSGHDRFALVVTVEGNGRAMKMSLAGRHQADATAAGAAEFARALAAGEVEQPGVWLPEEVISHERFFEALEPLGWKPTVEEVPAKLEVARKQRLEAT